MKLSRRSVLRGVGGAVLGLPFLESLLPRSARAQTPPRPRFAVFMRQGNGVAQGLGGEPERFWPRAFGDITTQSLSTTDADRTVSELSAHASKLLLVKGLRFEFPSIGCGHSAGGAQCLTAATISGAEAMTRADGESVDNRIARQLNPNGREPLTLYAGPRFNYLDEVLSYRGPGQLRAAEANPYNAYSRMTGVTAADEETRRRIASARLSVNDLVRSQMKSLLRDSQLSSEDRSRLTTHFEAVRELETQMACTLAAEKVAELNGVRATAQDEAIIEKAARLQADIIALGFACGYTRSATLQVGAGSDGTAYTIDGVRQPRFRQISHRIFSDGSEGAPIPDAALKHHQIDRLHARLFKYLLDRLSAHNLLDDSIAVWCNDLAHGVTHGYEHVPFILAGSGGGYLKTGRFVHANGGTGSTPHNRLFNTILNAVGCTKPDGSPVDDFGAASLPKGELALLKA